MPTLKHLDKFGATLVVVCLIFVAIGLSRGLGSMFSSSPTGSSGPATSPTPSRPTPTPGPGPKVFTSVSQTFAFGYVDNWTELPSQIDGDVTLTAFKSCDQVALVLTETKNQTLTKNTKLEMSKVDGQDAYITTEKDKSTTIAINDAIRNQVIQLKFTPTCGQSLDEAKQKELTPLLHSFTFESN